MLLLKKKRVVFKVKGEGPYVQYTPLENTVLVEEIPGQTPEAEIESLLDADTYYIVDPGLTKTSCNPSGLVQAFVIIVAFPDDRHWGGNSFTKRAPGYKGGMYRYFPPWTLAQLVAAGPLLSSRTVLSSRDEIPKNFEVFGGIPWNVFAASRVAEENKKNLHRKDTTLSVTQTENLLSGNFDIHANFGAGQPNGGLAVFSPYGNFTSVTVSLASDSVLLWIHSLFLDLIWTKLALYSSPMAWQLLESYMIETLMETKKYSVRQCVGKLHSLYSQTSTVSLGGCNSRLQQSDCTAAVRSGAGGVLHYSSDASHPLYDMIYKQGSVFFAFQVTVGRKHDAKAPQIKDIARRLEIGSEGRELRLYYAVHEGVFDQFVTDPVQLPCPPGVSIFHLSLQR